MPFEAAIAKNAFESQERPSNQTFDSPTDTGSVAVCRALRRRSPRVLIVAAAFFESVPKSDRLSSFPQII